MPIDHLCEESEARSYLADALGEGTLTLFLGAGASGAAGLPSWPELVRRLCTRVGRPSDDLHDGVSADLLQRAADEVKHALAGDDGEFAELVREVLYDGVQLSPDLIRSELLVAIGALLAGSRRGSVNRVMTLNFDSVMEWYLSLYGLVARVVSRPGTLEGGEDVRIYHPHGFLPHPAMDIAGSDFVTLGFDSVNERLGTPGDPWFELMRHTLNTSVCLFIGMSYRTLEDRAIAPLLAATRKHLRTIGDQRPTGFWLCDSHPRGSADPYPDLEARRQAFLRANVVPLFWKDDSEISRSLLAICQAAAKQILT